MDSSSYSSFNSSSGSFSLPFNENDSQEMLLYGVLAAAGSADHYSSSSSSFHAAAYEEVCSRPDFDADAGGAKEEMGGVGGRGDVQWGAGGCGFEGDSSSGSSPVLALKKRHSQKRKWEIKKKREREMMEKGVVVLEDLGAAYLDELLSISDHPCP
ncbi:hypothetical protein SAY86_021894 [Trapa natans]|uniref:Uncharacterized protein n=1 Tax=Trapa natans TaxID=22666 RepID=A0AAN7RF41_TRANT|nr:hypothetical protein SAY86_021894 [Trapa natans]